jgi:uncharacterized protein YqeY
LLQDDSAELLEREVVSVLVGQCEAGADRVSDAHRSEIRDRTRHIERRRQWRTGRPARNERKRQTEECGCAKAHQLTSVTSGHSYNGEMSVREQIEKDIITAMKAKEEMRLTTLRMVKSALKSKEIDKRAPLDEAETLQTLSTLIKQRHDSADQFTKGGRADLAEKEIAEVAIIESYMPKSASAEEVETTVKSAIEEMNAAGKTPTVKDMGLVMKAAMAKFQASGARVDGKLVSETVRKQLAQ